MRIMGRSSLPGIWLHGVPAAVVSAKSRRSPKAVQETTLMPDSQDCLTSANFICADLDSIVFA